MKFTSVAKTVWLGSMLLFITVLLVASGAPPVSVVLVVTGFVLIALGAHWALAQSRAARGKADSLGASLDDLMHLGKRGWVVTLVTAAVGGALALAGVLLASLAGA